MWEAIASVSIWTYKTPHRTILKKKKLSWKFKIYFLTNVNSQGRGRHGWLEANPGASQLYTLDSTSEFYCRILLQNSTALHSWCKGIRVPRGLRTVEKFPKISPRNFVFRIWRRSSTPLLGTELCRTNHIWSVLKKRNMTHHPLVCSKFLGKQILLIWAQLASVQIITISVSILVAFEAMVGIIVWALPTPTEYCDCKPNAILLTFIS